MHDAASDVQHISITMKASCKYRRDQPNKINNSRSPLESLIKSTPIVIPRDIDPSFRVEDLIPELFQGGMELGWVSRGEADCV